MSDVLIRRKDSLYLKTKHTIWLVGIALIFSITLLATSIVIQGVIFSNIHHEDDRKIQVQQSELSQATTAIITICDEIKHLGGQCPRIVIAPPTTKGK